MVSCFCIANFNGECIAENCHDEVRMLDANLGTPEARRKYYEFAVQAFDFYFSRGYEDDDFDE